MAEGEPDELANSCGTAFAGGDAKGALELLQKIRQQRENGALAHSGEPSARAHGHLVLRTLPA